VTIALSPSPFTVTATVTTYFAHLCENCAW
jgi:hypothetical protein